MQTITHRVMWIILFPSNNTIIFHSNLFNLSLVFKSKNNSFLAGYDMLAFATENEAKLGQFS